MPTAMIGPKFYAFDENGKPLSGGKVYTYQAGTSAPKPTYTGEDGSVANTNPVILNDAGYASIHLAGAYKIVLKDANDVTLWTADPVTDAAQRNSDFINEQAAIYLGPKKIRINGDVSAFYENGRAVRIGTTTGYQYGFVRAAMFDYNFTIIDLNGPVALSPNVVSAAGGIVTSALFGGYSAEQVADFGFLRDELKSFVGAGMVGTIGGKTVQQRFDTLADDYLTHAKAAEELAEHNQDTKAHPALTGYLRQLTNEAVTALDAAVYADKLFENVELGIAATDPGQYFFVISEENTESLILYKNTSDAGTGTGKTLTFTSGIAVKNTAGDAYNSKYTMNFSATVSDLAPGEPGTLTVRLEAKKSGGTFSVIASDVLTSSGSGPQSYPDQQIIGTFIDAGLNAEFKISVLGQGSATATTLVYQEGAPADAATIQKTIPNQQAIIDLVISAEAEADRAKDEADRAEAAANAAESTAQDYEVHALAAQADIDAEVLSVENAAIFAKTEIASNLSSANEEIQTQLDGLLNSGWFVVGEFATGFTFTARNQVGRDSSGEFWSYNGALPFTVAAGTVPSAPNYTMRGDAALRSALADPNSTVPVGGVESNKVSVFGRKLIKPSTANQTASMNALIATEKRVFGDGSNYTLGSISAPPRHTSIENLFLQGNVAGGSFASSLGTGIKYTIAQQGLVNSNIVFYKDAGIDISQMWGLTTFNQHVKSVNHPDRLLGTYGYGITTKSPTSTFSNAHKFFGGEIDACDVGVLASDCLCVDLYNTIVEGSGFGAVHLRNADAFQFPYYTEANNSGGGSYDMEYLTPASNARFSRANRMHGTYHNPTKDKKLLHVKGTHSLSISDVLAETKEGAAGSGVEGRITLGVSAVNTKARNLVNVTIEDSTGSEVRFEQDCELSGNLFLRSEQLSNASWTKDSQINFVEDVATDGALFLDGSPAMRINMKAGSIVGNTARLRQILSTTGSLRGKVVGTGVWMRAKSGQSLKVAPVMQATSDYSGDGTNLPVREIVSDKWTFVAFTGVINPDDASLNASFGWRLWAATGSATNGDGTYDVYIKYPRAWEGSLEHVKYLPTLGSAAKERIDGAGRIPVSAGDTSVTAPSGSNCQVFYSAPITAARTVTLDTANPIAGDRLTVTRTAAATGAFNVSVGALKTLTAAGQWATVVYDGAAWQLAAQGVL